MNPFITACRLIEQTLNLPQKSESQITAAINNSSYKGKKSRGLHGDMVICGLLVYSIDTSDKRKWSKLRNAANDHWREVDRPL